MNESPTPSTPPSTEQAYAPLLLSKLVLLWDFVGFVARRFGRDQCAQSAGVLSYTSLLSIVPLMAVTLSMLSAFPVFGGLDQIIWEFMAEYTVPAVGDSVQQYLQDFTAKASTLTIPGIIVLLITALMLMSAIDQSLNRIFRTRRKRTMGSRFLVYWAVLTLGPILIGVSITLTSYLVSLPMLTEAGDAVGLTGIRRVLLGIAPYLAGAFGFVMLYVLVPTRRVPFGHAVLGGLVAAVFFEVAKRGFAWYVTSFPTYEAIYGAMAAVPIFLVWIYLSWLIILLGAEITHALLAFRQASDTGGGNDFMAVYHVLGRLYDAQSRGELMNAEALAEVEPELDIDATLQLLQGLADQRVVSETIDHDWIWRVDVDEWRLIDLYRSAAMVLPLPAKLRASPNNQRDQRLAEVLDNAQGHLNQSLDIPLAQLYQPSDPSQ